LFDQKPKPGTLVTAFDLAGWILLIWLQPDHWRRFPLSRISGHPRAACYCEAVSDWPMPQDALRILYDLGADP
jgi:hypothetical protein